MLDQLGDTAAPSDVGHDLSRLSVGVVALARELSKLAPKGEEAVPPMSGASGVVNAAPGAIGLRCGGFADEFDAVGLGRFRDNDLWNEREPG